MTEILVHWLHVTAAVTWIGGMIFFPLVLIPALKMIDPPPKRIELIQAAGRRLRVIGWICIGILLFTGVSILISDPQYAEDPSLSATLTIKLALVAIMVVSSFLHDFVLGPKVATVAREGGNPGSLRKVVIGMARVNLLIGLAVIGFGVVLGAR